MYGADEGFKYVISYQMMLVYIKINTSDLFIHVLFDLLLVVLLTPLIMSN